VHRQGLRFLRSWPRTEADGPLEGRKTFCAAALLISAFVFVFMRTFLFSKALFVRCLCRVGKRKYGSGWCQNANNGCLFCDKKRLEWKNPKNLAFIRAWISELFPSFSDFRQRHKNAEECGIL